MHVFVPKFTNSDHFPILPFIDRRNASLLLFPIAVNQKGSMTIGFLPNSNILIVCSVKLAFRVLGMVDPSHSMRMSFADQSRHSLFFKSSYQTMVQFFMLHCQRIGQLKFYSITLEMKFLLRRTPQFHFSSTHQSLLVRFLST